MARLRWSWTSRSRFLTAAFAFALSVSSAAHAQDENNSAPVEEEAMCFPECRSGYFCHEGTCISLCNPPCASDESCTSDGECVPKEAHGAPRLPITTSPPAPPEDKIIEGSEEEPDAEDNEETSKRAKSEPQGIVAGLGAGAAICASSAGCNTFERGDFGADVHIIGGYRLLDWLVLEGGATYTHLFIATEEDATGAEVERTDFLLAVRAGARFFPLKRRKFIEPVIGLHTGYIMGFAKAGGARDIANGLNLDYLVGVDFKFTEVFSLGIEATVYEPLWMTTCSDRESQLDDDGNEIFASESGCFKFEGKRDLFYFNFATQATLFF